MPSLRLLGAYCNAQHTSLHVDAWNIASHQGPGEAGSLGWKAGRDDFEDQYGLTRGTLNSGQDFSGGAGLSQVDYCMLLAQQIYPNGTDYVPICGTKLLLNADFQTSPATGNTYGWNDAQAYRDTANGLWDNYWSTIPKIMKARNRPYYVLRPGYENDRSFMQDFVGWDAESQEAACKAIRRILWLQITTARQIGGVYPIVGSNFSNGSGSPSWTDLNNSIGSDVMNILQTDDYSVTWETTVPTSGPLNLPTNLSDYWVGWDNRTGEGNLAFFNEAVRLGLTYIGYSETGTGGAAGADHDPGDNIPYRFWSYRTSRADMARAQGLKIAYHGIWSPSDTGNMQDPTYKPNTMADLRANIQGMIGDPIDPTTITFGNRSPVRIPGSSFTPAVQTPGFAGQTVMGTGTPPPPASESLTINTPTNVTTGVAVTLSGTYANGSPSAFDYSIDSGSTWVALASVSATGGSWSGIGPTFTLAVASQTIIVRDHAQTSITATTSAFPVTVPGAPPPAIVIGGTGPDTLTLQMSEDAYQGDAQFSITIDGAKVGGTQTVTAIHANGATQAFSVLGSFAAATHSFTINFLNDAYGGSAALDRNLYLVSATLNGAPVSGATISIFAPADTHAVSFGNSQTETLTINTPTGVITGAAVTLSGTYANGSPSAFDYSVNAGTTWTALASVSATGGTWSGIGPTFTTAVASQTIVVRDHAQTSVTATTAAFAVTVTAPPPPPPTTVGTSHGYVKAVIYVTAWSPTGPFEVSAMMCNPITKTPLPGGDASGLPAGRFACVAEIRNGTTLLGAAGGPNDPAAVAGGNTWQPSWFTTGGDTIARSFTATQAASVGASMFPGRAVTLSSAGRMPTGLSAGTMYWVADAGGTATSHNYQLATSRAMAARATNVPGALNSAAYPAWAAGLSHTIGTASGYCSSAGVRYVLSGTQTGTPTGTSGT